MTNQNSKIVLIAAMLALLTPQVAFAEKFVGLITGWSRSAGLPPSYLDEDWAYDNPYDCEQNGNLNRCTLLVENCAGYELWVEESVAANWIEKLAAGGDIEFLGWDNIENTCSF